jgi:hypothetical protein
MNLIYDIDLIFSSLWCEPYLLNQRPDVINGVVGGSIQFMDIERASFVERCTGMTLITSFPVRLQVLTVDCFCQDTGTGSRFSQLIVFARIRAQVVLPTPLGPQKRKACAS